MKSFKLLILLSGFLIIGCIDRQRPILFTTYTPVLITRSSLTKSIALQNAEPILEAAKIYYKDGYIFISERFKGVHIINNANPSAPVNQGFIAVPGCLDMAIKSNVLYVDNAIDLVAIDLTKASKGELEVLTRVQSVFPEPAPPDGGAIPEKFSTRNRPANTIIINWKQ